MDEKTEIGRNKEKINLTKSYKKYKEVVESHDFLHSERTLHIEEEIPLVSDISSFFLFAMSLYYRHNHGSSEPPEFKTPDKAMGNHSTIFLKKSWQHTDNRGKESVERHACQCLEVIFSTISKVPIWYKYRRSLNFLSDKKIKSSSNNASIIVKLVLNHTKTHQTLFRCCTPKFLSWSFAMLK